ncbi:hypothetical protein GCM10011392_27640 [Wenxinia marina]|nr:hypothetical protein GCM10011392_27640 [Wenxinia marina]
MGLPLRAVAMGPAGQQAFHRAVAAEGPTRRIHFDRATLAEGMMAVLTGACAG